jgi:hypothetical protein
MKSRGLTTTCVALIFCGVVGGADENRPTTNPPPQSEVSAATGALGTNLGKADLVVARLAVQPTLFKGNFGEAHMNRHLSAYLGRPEGWSALTSRLGPQGIDGVGIRFDVSGRPVGLIVMEAKYGSSRLGTTRDGIQLGDRWVQPRVNRLGAEYRAIAESARTGRLSVATKGSVGRQRLSFPMDDGKAAVFARDPGGSWEFVGRPDRLAEAAGRAGQIGDHLGKAAQGQIAAEKYISRIVLRDGAFQVRVKDATHLDQLGRESALPVTKEISIPLSGPKMGTIVRVTRPEVARLLRERFPSMSRTDVDDFARSLTQSPRDLERLFASNPRSLLGSTARATLLAGALAGGVDTIFQAAFQYYIGGRVDWGVAARSGIANFGGGAVGAGAGQGAVIFLTRNAIGQQFAQRTSQILGVGSARLVTRVTGFGVGGAVANIATAYLGYALGLYDLETANRIGVVGIAGLAAGAATPIAMTTLATWIGMTSTGTAISSLSGAAATSATAAWWGGGSLAAGGWGVAGGSIIMTGGTIVIAVAGAAVVGQVFRYFDQVEENRRVTLTIKDLKSRTTFPRTRRGGAEVRVQRISSN